MAKEYRILYKINDKGFAKDQPWIDCEVETLDEALQALADLNEFNATKMVGYKHETWIEMREVKPWKRLEIK